MPAPHAIIVRERRCQAPTRRYVYHALETGAYERKTQLWRASIADWHTSGTEVIDCVAIDGSLTIATE